MLGTARILRKELDSRQGKITKESTEAAGNNNNNNNNNNNDDDDDVMMTMMMIMMMMMMMRMMMMMNCLFILLMCALFAQGLYKLRKKWHKRCLTLQYNHKSQKLKQNQSSYH